MAERIIKPLVIVRRISGCLGRLDPLDCIGLDLGGSDTSHVV
jgi:hypothetical protein